METVKRTWIGKVFPYIGHLESELALARAERATILDRLVRVTTGYGLDQEMPDHITAEKEVRELNAMRGARTPFDLARELERVSLEESEENRKRGENLAEAEKAKAN
jgi:hypothetical protein